MTSVKDLSERSRAQEQAWARKLAVALEINPKLATHAAKLFALEAQAKGTLVADDPYLPKGPLDSAGEVEIGVAVSSNGQVLGRVGLRRDELPRHIQIAGYSGAGKTFLNYKITKALLEQGTATWFFDQTQQYRHLLRDHANLRVVKFSDLRLNLLAPPPGVSPHCWIQFFAEAFCHSVDLLVASKGFLLERLDALLRECKPSNGSDRFPSLFDLEQDLSNLKLRPGAPERLFLARILNRVRAMRICTGDVFDCERGFPLEEMEKQSIVFEFDGLAEELTGVVIELLLFWIYCRRLESRANDPLIVVIDEAKKVFDVNKERKPAAGIPNIDVLLSRVRELNIGFIVTDQEPSKLVHSLHANTGTKICLGLLDGRDQMAMSDAMGLGPEHRQVLKAGLPKRVAIITIAGRLQQPVLLRMDDVSVAKTVTTDEVIQHSRPFIAELSKNVLERRDDSKDCEAVARSSLSKICELFLASVATNPSLGVVERYKALGISNNAGSTAKKRLIAEGLIREGVIQSGKKGGQKKALELTKSGEEYLRGLGVRSTSQGKGGVAHKHAQHTIAQFFRARGDQALIEQRLANSEVDVLVVHPNGQRTAIEVAMEARGQLEHVRHHLSAGLDAVIVACRNLEVLKRVRSDVAKAFGGRFDSRIRFCLASDFESTI